MAERRPLVLISGRQKELPIGDTLPPGAPAGLELVYSASVSSGGDIVLSNVFDSTHDRWLVVISDLRVTSATQYQLQLLDSADAVVWFHNGTGTGSQARIDGGNTPLFSWSSWSVSHTIAVTLTNAPRSGTTKQSSTWESVVNMLFNPGTGVEQGTFRADGMTASYSGDAVGLKVRTYGTITQGDIFVYGY